MYRDPDLTWDGAFPYDVLVPAGITPASSIREVLDSISYFTQQRQGDEGQQAWRALRVVQERLLIDFFLYRTAQQEPEEGERG